MVYRRHLIEFSDQCELREDFESFYRDSRFAKVYQNKYFLKKNEDMSTIRASHERKVTPLFQDS